MALIGMASDDWCGCGSNVIPQNVVNVIKPYLDKGFGYLQRELATCDEKFLNHLAGEVYQAQMQVAHANKIDNPYFIWDGRPDKIDRFVTTKGVAYIAIPTSPENAGTYGEVLEWLNDEGWPIQGEIEFLDDMPNPHSTRRSDFTHKNYPPATFRFILKDSTTKKNFEADFKHYLNALSINM